MVTAGKEATFKNPQNRDQIKHIHELDWELVRDQHVLLIEDDPKFISHITHLANACSLPITTIWPPFNANAFDERSFAPYTLLLVDFDLGNSNGLEIADSINLFVKRLPTILISSSLDFADEQGILPRYIDAFIPKSKGAVHILRHSLQLASFLTVTATPCRSKKIKQQNQNLLASEF